MPPSKGEKGLPQQVTPQNISKVICAFEKLGFTHRRKKSRGKGSHHVLTKKGLARPVIFTEHGKEIPPNHIKNNLRSAGITIKNYLKALDEC